MVIWYPFHSYSYGIFAELVTVGIGCGTLYRDAEPDGYGGPYGSPSMDYIQGARHYKEGLGYTDGLPMIRGERRRVVIHV